MVCPDTRACAEKAGARLRAGVAAAMAAAVAGSIAVALALGTEWEGPGAGPAVPADPVAPAPAARAGSTLGERAALMEEPECLAEGGEWRWVNAFFEACVLPYPDAGRGCSSSAECEGGRGVAAPDHLCL